MRERKPGSIRLLNPVDKMFFKLGGIDSDKEMNWKQHLVALLTINLVWFHFAHVHTDEHELASIES